MVDSTVELVSVLTVSLLWLRISTNGSDAASIAVSVSLAVAAEVIFDTVFGDGRLINHKNNPAIAPTGNNNHHNKERSNFGVSGGGATTFGWVRSLVVVPAEGNPVVAGVAAAVGGGVMNDKSGVGEVVVAGVAGGLVAANNAWGSPLAIASASVTLAVSIAFCPGDAKAKPRNAATDGWGFFL